MKIGKIRTAWIILLSALFTVNICFQSILMQLTRKINRKWIDKTIHIWVRRVLKLARINCNVINPSGVEPKKGQPTIIMCNHSSLYDIPLSFYAFPDHSIRMLAKKELFKIPIMGKGMEAAEFPFIDRRNLQQAIKDLEKIHELLTKDIVIWVAPEGTRSKDGKLGKFKKGGFITAIKTKAVIIPIGIQGANKILPARTLRLNLNQTASVYIGQPIDTSEYTLETKELLIKKVHGEMKKLLEK